MTKVVTFHRAWPFSRARGLTLRHHGTPFTLASLLRSALRSEMPPPSITGSKFLSVLSHYCQTRAGLPAMSPAPPKSAESACFARRSHAGHFPAGAPRVLFPACLSSYPYAPRECTKPSKGSRLPPKLRDWEQASAPLSKFRASSQGILSWLSQECCNLATSRSSHLILSSAPVTSRTSESPVTSTPLAQRIWPAASARHAFQAWLLS
jgi:hypothetical protein